MKRLLTLITFFLLAAVVAGNVYAKKSRHHTVKQKPSKTTRHRLHRGEIARHTQHEEEAPLMVANTDAVSADSLLTFAQALIGTRYNPGSSSPVYGFDCSGFVSYVFKSFNVKVPRSSCEFAGIGERIGLGDAKPGDVILFTGTKSHHPHSIGHVGIVFSNNDDGLKFIHSTSGKEYCVTISAMDDTYKRRFVEIVRVLKRNDDVLASR